MTYGRSVLKALDKFGLDVSRWPELAADRAAWREMLQTGLAPPAFRPPPPPPPPPPISRTKSARDCTAATNAAIDATLRLERRPLKNLGTQTEKRPSRQRQLEKSQRQLEKLEGVRQ